VTTDGRVSTDRIHASYGTREPICKECLTKILPMGYILEVTTVIECGTCPFSAEPTKGFGLACFYGYEFFIGSWDDFESTGFPIPEKCPYLKALKPCE
jgi:hypothetical protein